MNKLNKDYNMAKLIHDQLNCTGLTENAVIPIEVSFRFFFFNYKKIYHNIDFFFFNSERKLSSENNN